MTNKILAGETVFATTYVCKDWEGEIRLSNEHVEYQWMYPSDLVLLNFGEDCGFFSASINAFMNDIMI